MAAGKKTKIIGLPELIEKLQIPEWYNLPAGRFLDKWRFSVQRKTVKNFKRGKGGWIGPSAQTRRSITSERDESPNPQWAKVGSNLKTARWGEYGTGLLSEDPKSAHKRHWPPGAALQSWALKHGFVDKTITRGPNKGKVNTAGSQVARIIGLRGGIAPRRYLRDAAADIEPKIPIWLKEFALDIERQAPKSHAE